MATCARCSKDIEPDSNFCRYCGTSRIDLPGGSRRLTRLPAEGKLAGVCAGVADYLQVDVTLVRLVWVTLTIIPGALIGGIVAYVGAWLLMPEGAATTAPGPAGRRLYRSTTDRKIAGICSGFARYFGLDVTVVRVLFVILAIYPGAVVCGVVAYVVGWLLIPAEPAAPFAPVPSPA